MGSDYPLVRARTVIGQVESSGLSRSDKELMVLGGNAARLLRNLTKPRITHRTSFYFGLGSISLVIAHSG